MQSVLKTAKGDEIRVQVVGSFREDRHRPPPFVSQRFGSLGIPGMPTISCDPDVGHFDHESYVSRHQALWRKSKLIGRQPVSCELGFLLYGSY